MGVKNVLKTRFLEAEGTVSVSILVPLDQKEGLVPFYVQ